MNEAVTPGEKTREDRLRSAALTCLTASIINMFFAVKSAGVVNIPMDVRAAVGGVRGYLLTHPMLVIGFFVTIALFTMVVGLALARGYKGSLSAGLAVAYLLIANVVLVVALGPLPVLPNVVLGIMALTNLHLAKTSPA